MDQREIRQIADSVRLAYWANKNLPINTEHIIEFGIRLEIQPIPKLYVNFGIHAWLKLDCIGIVVDAEQYMNERFDNLLRFSFAHELGHFFLHRHLFKELNFNSLEEWQAFILRMPIKEYRSFEFQANEFGGRLVVPLPDLKIAMIKACEKLKQEDLLIEYLPKAPDLVLSCISPSLCRPFGISEYVIEERVKREELWPPKDYFPDLF